MFSEQDTELSGFELLGLPQPLLKALKEMGFIDPTPVQSASYQPIIDGLDLVIQGKGGSGKTAAYGLPLASLVSKRGPGVESLILAPTKETVVLVCEELKRIFKHTGQQCVELYDGAPISEQIQSLQKAPQVVVGTPIRALEHLRRGSLYLDSLKVMVLDDLDEMIAQGLKKEIEGIGKFLPPKRQVLFVTATIPYEIRQMARQMLRNAEILPLGDHSLAGRNIDHIYYLVPGTSRSSDLLSILDVGAPQHSLVICNSNREAESLTGILNDQGLHAVWLDASLPRSELERVADKGRQHLPVIYVATDVAVLNLDVPLVDHVYNYTLPADISLYIHRALLARKAHGFGTMVSLVAPTDIGQYYILKKHFKINLKERSMPTPEELDALRDERSLNEVIAGLPVKPAEDFLILARRILDREDRESLVAGLLEYLVEGEDRGEEALEEDEGGEP